jgi:hypothetical protein
VITPQPLALAVLVAVVVELVLVVLVHQAKEMQVVLVVRQVAHLIICQVVVVGQGRREQMLLALLLVMVERGLHLQFLVQQ